MFATLYLTYTISIHVLREEDDALKICRQLRVTISIHVLREEDDGSRSPPRTSQRLFLSTSSARRTTCIPPLHQPRDAISIHVLREEDDLGASRLVSGVTNISIHVLREEDDGSKRYKADNFLYFYPRPPRGGRQSREAR